MEEEAFVVLQTDGFFDAFDVLAVGGVEDDT